MPPCIVPVYDKSFRETLICLIRLLYSGNSKAILVVNFRPFVKPPRPNYIHPSRNTCSLNLHTIRVQWVPSLLHELDPGAPFHIHPGMHITVLCNQTYWINPD